MRAILPFLNNTNILIFDLETTGFPKSKSGFRIGPKEYYSPTNNSKYDTSRIVQIGWTHIENFSFDNLLNVEIQCVIRKPTDFDDIPNSHIHGITFDQAQQEGIEFKQIIDTEGFGYALCNSDYIVAHNVYFDTFVLLNELYRINYKKCANKIEQLMSNNKCICTGEYSKNICKLPQKVPGYKMPKLSELYEYYYKSPPQNQHNAGSDVKTIVDILSFDM